MLRSLLTSVSCIALAFAAPVAAIAADTTASQTAAPVAQPKDTASKEANSKVEQRKDDQTAEKRKQVISEAMSALNETQNALKALDDRKNQDAIAALERATGKLEIILAREPKLALAPTNVGAVTIDVIADTDKVKEVRKEAERMLDDGQVQAARHLLEGLASETVISVTNLPLATYPDAIKQAAKLIHEDKPEDAKRVLQTALNTLVVTNTIIPLPVVTAEEMLKEAETLAEKADRKAEENTRLDTLLADARKELEFAQALGYGTKQDFKNLYEQLDEIKGKTAGGKYGKGFFTKIKEHLKETVKSSQQEKPGQAAPATNSTTTNANPK